MKRQLVEQAILAGPFSEALELVIEEVSPDYVCMQMPFSMKRTTIADIVHGGAIAALIDTVATAAAWSGVDAPETYRGTTIGFSVSFLSAARGVDLVAEARVTRRGRSICFIDVIVRDPQGDPIASGLVSYKLSRSALPDPFSA